MDDIYHHPVFLMNSAGKVTRHEFDGSRVERKIDEDKNPILGLAHYYRCTETNVVRQWGFDEHP